MIIKSFSINYEKLFETYRVNLLYGENFHLKNEIVEKLIKIFKKNNYKTTFLKQDDLLKNIEILDNYINQDNLFGDKEILIIKDATDKLLDLQKKLKEVEEEKQTKGPSTVNNALFVGSTAELAKMLKHGLKEDNK